MQADVLGIKTGSDANIAVIKKQSSGNVMYIQQMVDAPFSYNGDANAADKNVILYTGVTTSSAQIKFTTNDPVVDVGCCVILSAPAPLYLPITILGGTTDNCLVKHKEYMFDLQHNVLYSLTDFSLPTNLADNKEMAAPIQERGTLNGCNKFVVTLKDYLPIDRSLYFTSNADLENDYLSSGLDIIFYVNGTFVSSTS